MDIKKLIDNADKIKNQVEETTVTVKIKRFEGLMDEPYVVIKRPVLSEIASITQHGGDDLHAIALTMKSPDLNNKELQKTYGANNPKALVRKIFTEEEQTELSMVVASLMGAKTRTEIIEEIKN